MQKPSDRLTDDHVEWIIDSQKRSVRISKTVKIIIRTLKWIYAALKWLADSLKWGVPLFLSILAAYHSGLLESLKGFYS